MKYLAAALAVLFVTAVHVPGANAETCAGGLADPACSAGAYAYVVVRPHGVVVRRPVARGCAWVRGRRVC